MDAGDFARLTLQRVQEQEKELTDEERIEIWAAMLKACRDILPAWLAIDDKHMAEFKGRPDFFRRMKSKASLIEDTERELLDKRRLRAIWEALCMEWDATDHNGVQQAVEVMRCAYATPRGKQDEDYALRRLTYIWIPPGAEGHSIPEYQTYARMMGMVKDVR